jgi:hypothetical protein
MAQRLVILDTPSTPSQQQNKLGHSSGPEEQHNRANTAMQAPATAAAAAAATVARAAGSDSGGCLTIVGSLALKDHVEVHVLSEAQQLPDLAFEVLLALRPTAHP